ncbi:2-amino-4-hydroxy-6-hydroxymethyldihydropteridine diphosphokinase [Denitratisoma oestradiolicum]|uniref:2-amino-4-hydroxy-6-hydroxymethyldihydropteridine pyrophosphokinase n=1 Tax=Denitratisoma oestradiolicum TaxID=311182 RepID=A0A6S6XV86_9PROT|nr:2-amino-4-hydroxy-6-hydroxymethyldihydropteridine diphosphokinase [Denitratisoma oestradiolicum]TWO79358.1 2-amino-4-hydroxy-6-hydroxymethyldihydropteridine diphosphokinase [Denitratisoma oestradiolicum]CAB1367967.1 2-amino-4-hydroxy-6-hydroxymethyldihyropteridine pyrophosphokinase [Denitratisoma oestradiolicum]
MKLAYVALGANLGDPIATVRAAIEALAALPGHRLKAVSSLYRTAPVGLLGQPDFINAVVALETPLLPESLLAELFAIEARFGRQRGIRNAPRTLDLDLLFHGDSHSDDPRLTLPHPRMHERAFVLAPLAEIAPAFILPGHGPITGLLDACADQGIERLPATALAA